MWISRSVCAALALGVMGFAGQGLGTFAKPAVPAQQLVQRGSGQHYELLGTTVHDVFDPARRIAYQIFVSLPPGYEANPDRRYPVVYVTDADYAFPLLRSISRRMRGSPRRVDDFILVGLSYANGQDGMESRRRDYTPTPNGAKDAPAGALHGESLLYRDYLHDAVFPFVEGHWRADSARRIYVGHSYGGLLGAHILLTKPEMFSGYVLGSPSFWYDKRYLIRQSPALLAGRSRVDARVYVYGGEYETQRPDDPRYLQDVDMVADNATFVSLLHTKKVPGLIVKSAVLPGEDHFSVAPAGFTRGLLHVLSSR